MKVSKILILHLLFAMFIFFSGCATKGSQFSDFQKPKIGEATLYIYNKSSIFYDSRSEINIRKLDTYSDIKLPILYRDGHIVEFLKPGVYDISAKFKPMFMRESKGNIIFGVKADQIYCVSFHHTPLPEFELEDIAKCQAQIKETRLSIER